MSACPGCGCATIARAASKDTDATDLILVHSIPSGVLSIARYASGPAAIASWVGQLKKRHVPESIEQLAHGRTQDRVRKSA